MSVMHYIALRTPLLMLSQILSEPVSKALMPGQHVLSRLFNSLSSLSHVHLQSEGRDEDRAQHGKVTPYEGAAVDVSRA